MLNLFQNLSFSVSGGVVQEWKKPLHHFPACTDWPGMLKKCTLWRARAELYTQITEASKCTEKVKELTKNFIRLGNIGIKVKATLKIVNTEDKSYIHGVYQLVIPEKSRVFICSWKHWEKSGILYKKLGIVSVIFACCWGCANLYPPTLRKKML